MLGRDAGSGMMIGENDFELIGANGTGEKTTCGGL